MNLKEHIDVHNAILTDDKCPSFDYYSFFFSMVFDEVWKWRKYSELAVLAAIYVILLLFTEFESSQVMLEQQLHPKAPDK